MSQVEENPDALWMSVVSPEPREIESGTLSISVLMEAGLGSRYAGIRLVLVQVGVPQEVENLQRIGSELPYGLTTCSNISKTSRSSSQLPFSTVVLGVEFWHERYGLGRWYYTVAPMPEALAQRSPYTYHNPPTPVPIATLFDSRIPWETQALRDSGTHSISLSFAHRGYDDLGTRYLAKRHLSVVSVRVLPCRRSRQTGRFASLPPEIILQIGLNLNKASHILSAALVSKSWFHIMKAFFQRLGWSKRFYVRLLDNLATAITSHSGEWGSRVTALNIHHQRIVESPRYYVHSFADIIKCTPNLRVLDINLFVMTWAQDPISKLQHLEELICSAYGMKGQTATRLISIRTIQETLSTIPKLRWLSLSGIGRVDGARPCDFAAPSTPFLSQLSKLQIDNEKTISPAQLQHFLSCPNQPPRLKVLDLENVEGFSPTELSKFLSSVAPTLCSLRIINCDNIVRYEDGRLALDEVIEEMHSLRKIELKGRILSSTIVAFQSHPVGELGIHACAKTLNTEQGQDILEMIRSVGSMGWSTLNIRLTNASHVMNNKRETEAEELAKENGFEILYNSAPMPKRAHPMDLDDW